MTPNELDSLGPYSRIVLEGILASADYKEALVMAIVKEKDYQISTASKRQYYEPAERQAIAELRTTGLIDARNEPTKLVWDMLPLDLAAEVCKRLRAKKLESDQMNRAQSSEMASLNHDLTSLTSELKEAQRMQSKFAELANLLDRCLSKLGLDVDWILAISALNAQEVAVANRLKKLSKFKPMKMIYDGHGRVTYDLNRKVRTTHKNFHDLATDLHEALGIDSPKTLLAAGEDYRERRAKLCHEGGKMEENDRKTMILATQLLVEKLAT
jgi:hypothetical protein